MTHPPQKAVKHFKVTIDGMEFDALINHNVGFPTCGFSIHILDSEHRFRTSFTHNQVQCLYEIVKAMKEEMQT